MTEDEYRAIVSGVAETLAFFEHSQADSAYEGAAGVAEAIAYQLRLQFPKFDTDEFLKSCGVA